MAFEGGPPPPPTPPSPSSSAAGEPPWRGGGNGGGGIGGGNGSGSGPRGIGPNGNSEFLLVLKAGESAREVRVRVKEGDVNRLPRTPELQAVYRQLNRDADWANAKIVPSASSIRSENRTVSVELIIPSKDPFLNNAPPVRGRFDVRWQGAARQGEQETTVASASDELKRVAKESKSYRDGLQRLIKSLRVLKFEKNAVDDVRFFFDHTVYDIVITRHESPALGTQDG